MIAGREGSQQGHLWQVDVLRLLPMLGVVAVHVIIFTAPATSNTAGALLMLLHVNREVFFFVTAFVLTYVTGAASKDLAIRPFWRRRFPLVAGPYLAWTLIYWLATKPPQIVTAFSQLGSDLAVGWFHLYFLLVTMQFYALFPLLAWLVRCSWGWHRMIFLASAAFQLAFATVVQYQWSALPGPLAAVFGYSQQEITSYLFYFVAGMLAAAHLANSLEWLREHRSLAVAASAGAVLIGLAAYAVNLGMGEPPLVASGVFQPAVIPLAVGSITGLWLLAERLLDDWPLDGRWWRLIRVAADSSFGIYTAHMIPLILLTMTPAYSWLGMSQLPWQELTVLRFFLVLAGTAGLLAVLRRSPVSRLLTGRASLLRRRSGPTVESFAIRPSPASPVRESNQTIGAPEYSAADAFGGNAR